MESREAAKWFALFIAIIVGYFGYNQFWGEGNNAFGITRSMKGEMVTVEANVVAISGGKGHIFPILKDPNGRKTIKGVLFKSETDPEENRLQKELLEAKRKDGTLVTIEGLIDIYNGELEIIIKKAY